MLAIRLGVTEPLVLQAITGARQEHENVLRLIRRRRHVQSINFNWNNFADDHLLRDFRFRLTEIKKISDTLKWPGVTQRSSYICDPMIACAVMLFRLATTTRWYDAEIKFGMFSGQLSEVFWEMIELLLDKCGQNLVLDGENLVNSAEKYADAIHEAGAPYPDCIGFIDCTKIKMQRPGGHSSNQRACYSGHKRMHCLNYQTLSTPDGLIFALHGPVEGRRHDLTLLRNSGWVTVLQECLSTAERQFYIFGDQAYLLRPWMMRPFIGNLTALQELQNAQMSSIRVSVEHNYKDLKQLWVSQDFARNLKVRQAPIGLLYKASALLLNFRTCAYSCGQTSARFNVVPPSLEEYLSI